jgi:hypothetical protein
LVRNVVISKTFLICAVGVFVAALLFLLYPRTAYRSLSRHAPQNAIVLLEIRDPTRLLLEISSTLAFKSLLPDLKLRGTIGLAAGVRSMIPSLLLNTDLVEILLESQVGVLVTGFEIEGETLKPDLSFIINSDVPEAKLRGLAEGFGAPFRRAFGDVLAERTTYSSIRIDSMKSKDGEHRILWCIVDNTLVLGNSEPALKATIGATHKRIPSLDESPQFQMTGWPEREGAVVGYVNLTPLVQTLKSGPAGLLPTDSRTAIVRDLLSLAFGSFDFSLVYELGVEGGMVIDQYDFITGPLLTQGQSQSISVTNKEVAILNLIPRNISGCTVLRCDHPAQTMDAFSSTLRRQLNAGQLLLLEEATLNLKRSLGFTPEETLLDLIGDELAIVEMDHPDSLFILASNDLSRTAAMGRKYLLQTGGEVIPTTYQGVEVSSSSNGELKSICFINSYVLIGPRPLLHRCIDAYTQEATLAADPELSAMIREASKGAFEITVHLDRTAMATLIQGLSQSLYQAGVINHAPTLSELRLVVDSLPPTIRTSRATATGIQSRTRSALGDAITLFDWGKDPPGP